MRLKFPRITWNYYRLHLTFFTIHPIIWSGIFYGANGRFKISYVDSFFLCFSAQTVTGLSTVNLSSLTGLQQFILFWLMLTGSYTTTSWVMVLVRRHYFIQKCAHVIRKKRSGRVGRALKNIRTKTMDVWNSSTPWASPGFPRTKSHVSVGADGNRNVSRPFDARPAREAVEQPASPEDSAVTQETTPEKHTESPMPMDVPLPDAHTPTVTWPELQRTTSPSSMPVEAPRTPFVTRNPPQRIYTRDFARTTTMQTGAGRSSAIHTADASAVAHERDFGGFPGPLTLGAQLARRVAPGTVSQLERKMTRRPPPRRQSTVFPRTETGATVGLGLHRSPTGFPRTQTAATSVHFPPDPTNADARSSADWQDDLEAFNERVKSVFRSGALWVGRNSLFDTDALTDEELDEVGGVEYRALNLLAWLVPAFMMGTIVCCFIIHTAYLTKVHTYDSVFENQFRIVPVAWFSIFQAMSAYTGGGMSLVDTGMVPFVGAYLLVISLGMLIIAGNMLMPVCLRLCVWVMHEMLPQDSDHRQPLRFLLDHPRRCYLYLFPAHQSWFLVAVFLFLTAIEWIGFWVFDIGLQVYESLPVGQRVLAGLFQSLGVRASGFSIVSLQALAPAVKVLYLVMMYISAYPIAMSLRSTNVYEERSLGVYHAGQDETNEEEEPKGEIFSKYLGWHVRKQLSFDLWWLAAALFVICAIERTEILEPSNDFWFNQFSVLFDIISAYATVGLSLGIPTENFSFAGALRPGSKLILCAVMLRGRHRDLPVAVDRAILLPEEFTRFDDNGRHVISDTDNAMLSPTRDDPPPLTGEHPTPTPLVTGHDKAQ